MLEIKEPHDYEPRCNCKDCRKFFFELSEERQEIRDRQYEKCGPWWE